MSPVDIISMGNLIRIPWSMALRSTPELDPGAKQETFVDWLPAATASAAEKAASMRSGEATATGPMCPPSLT
jgi:hypothetical protein